MKFDVLGMGLVALDHIFIDRGAQNDEERYTYLGSAGGGSVGNTLSFLGALGFKTAIIGAVGNDIQSDIIKQDFKNFGVYTGLLVEKGSLGSKFRRSRQYFHVISEANHAHKFLNECPSCQVPTSRSVILKKSDISKEMVQIAQNSRIIHIDRANDASILLAKATLKAGGIVSFDFSFDSFESTRSKVRELIPISTIVKVNSNTFKNFLSRNKIDSLDAFSDRFENIRLLIITKGEQGIEGYIRGSKFDIQKFDYNAIECSRLCDTAGAGDILVGAILAQILNRSVQLETGYEQQILSIAQALASLSCSFYGARSYSRILTTNKVFITETFALGSEIVNVGKSYSSLPPTSGIPAPFKFPFRFEAYNICQICGARKSTYINRKSTLKCKKNGFSEKLAEALPTMIEAYFWADKRKRVIDIESKSALFIGSGSSLSAGVFGEQILFSLRGCPSTTTAPYELRSISAPLKNILPILISYGGENKDVLYAFDRVRALKALNGIIVTGSPDSTLARCAEDCGWQVYKVPKHYQGHVATTGYLATLSSLSAILAPDNIKKELKEFFEERTLNGIFRSADIIARDLCDTLELLPNEYHFLGLGSGWAKSALFDLESKFVEGGISTFEYSELKNWTHGRYISAYQNHRKRVAIIMKCPPYNDLADYIHAKLKKQMRVFELKTDRPSIPGGIELAIRALYLAKHLQLKLGKDITKPMYPKEAKGLYSWEPKERSSSEFIIPQNNI